LHACILDYLCGGALEPRRFNQESAVRLQLFAEHAAIAIHNAQLYERAEKLALIEERQRLSRNLHDAVSQTLFASRMIAEALPQIWKRHPEAVLMRLEQIRDLNQSAHAEMRALLLELNPQRLVETNIDTLMRQLVDGVLGRVHIDATLKIEKDLTLPSTVHVAVYYITQEALNNVIRHAAASKVTVSLRENEGQLELRIADNGRGFNVREVMSDGFGLNNMHERARASHGSIDFNSEAGRGTTIVVVWTH